MAQQTLFRRGSPLAAPLVQLEILAAPAADGVSEFDDALAAHGRFPLIAERVRTLQINVGKLCNQTCTHCHVDAGPDRREIMTRETMQDCLDALDRSEIETVDLTGGAPEMNPNFRWFVAELRYRGKHVIDRCNLTILTANGFQDLPEFLAEQQVEVIASLPCYLEENCDRQRGDGVFERSIAGLRRLNQVGYAQSDSGLALNLVYNPVGPSLPPDQGRLEASYKQQLRDRFGIEFNRLYTITNMPISRFLEELLQTGRYEDYLRILAGAFNPAAVDGLMCRSVLSVDWQGRLYDCDFNQMLELPVEQTLSRHIRGFRSRDFDGRDILTGRHCYGCTAGAGSSCQGSIIESSEAAR
ncbi:MAG: arsenosugar biosynthesis radical SAM protein ArsS [Planctomycetaceae bacterium]